jgi:hypothetical protein
MKAVRSNFAPQIKQEARHQKTRGKVDELGQQRFIVNLEGRQTAVKTGSKVPASSSTRAKADIKVVAVPHIDIAATKQHVLAHWTQYSAPQIVALFRKQYDKNTGTLSSQLSRFKSDLSVLPRPPPDAFLQLIKLTRTEYSSIRTGYQKKRAKEAMSVTVIPNADKLVEAALAYIASDDPRLVYAGLVVCSGWRPVEILKVARVTFNLTDSSRIHPGHWLCQNRYAKRGNVKAEYAALQCRDKPFLCPAWLVERALKMIHAQWNVEVLSNQEIHVRYGTHMSNLIKKAFPFIMNVSHVLLRRFYAAYAYIYFKDDFPRISPIAFTSHVLGHVVLGDEAISYTSLQLHNAGALKLFEEGKKLKAAST